MEPLARRGKKPINLTDIENVIDTARSSAEELRRATELLPNVDEEGTSECPFAEELYAKKEEIQRKVEGLFRRLHECKADVEWLIQSCKRDLTVVSAHEDQLNGDQARDKFSEAEAVLAAKYKAYLRLRDRIKEAIQVVDKALREAVSKRYPGKIPEQWPGMEFSSKGAHQGQQPESEPSGADAELNDLFELDRSSQSGLSPLNGAD